MRTIVYGVDTADNLEYTCFVSGSKTAIIETYKKLDKILVEHNIRGVFHWKSISSRVRKRVAEPLFEICNDSKLRFIIFEHKRPQNVPHEQFFFTKTADKISEILGKQLCNKSFNTVIFFFDDDFHIKTIKNGTLEFMRAIIRRLAYNLSGKNVKVTGSKSVIVEFKHKGFLIEIKSYLSNRNTNFEIQIADIILGLYRFLPQTKTSSIFRKYEILRSPKGFKGGKSSTSLAYVPKAR